MTTLNYEQIRIQAVSKRGCVLVSHDLIRDSFWVTRKVFNTWATQGIIRGELNYSSNYATPTLYVLRAF